MKRLTLTIVAILICSAVFAYASMEELVAAAERGNPKAQYDLGWCYLRGQVVPQDLKEAVKWLRKAADQGEIGGQFVLGELYMQGFGVNLPKDPKEAVKWYRKAAEQGSPDAQSKLGVCYFLGQGAPQDYKEAVKWLQKAAGQGNRDAQFTLGFCYEDGRGVPKDPKESVKWHRKAAEQGVALAQTKLGFAYGRGQGVPQDFGESYFWFNLAASNGQDASIRDAIGEMLSAQKRDEIQTRCTKWMEEFEKRRNASPQKN